MGHGRIPMNLAVREINDKEITTWMSTAGILLSGGTKRIHNEEGQGDETLEKGSEKPLCRG